ncbi:hypothetical protein ACFV5M_23855, partial [Streptomyces albidoflavus]
MASWRASARAFDASASAEASAAGGGGRRGGGWVRGARRPPAPAGGATGGPGLGAWPHAVASAIDDSSHLLVQAGTGTGKSLGYL